MEFKKIGDRKFQCRLNAEDLEDNNISLDDFFNNDAEKIHDLLEIIMEEAQKNIGVTLNGDVMSLQLAPLPDHSILLTVSSGKDDFGSMLKRVGESFDKLGLPVEDQTESEKEDVPKVKENTRKPITVNAEVVMDQLGEVRFDILYGAGKKTHANCLVISNVNDLIKKRVEFIVANQQMKSSNTRRDAYMVYDNEKNEIYLNNTHNCNPVDRDEGAERVGMGVLLAKYYQLHPVAEVKASLLRYASFLRNRLQDADYKTFSSVDQKGRNRAYNYVWVADFYFQMYKITNDKQYAKHGYMTLRSMFKQFGHGFYAIGIPVRLGLQTLKNADMQREYQELENDYIAVGDTFLKNGLNYPASEVNYEQAIVAPSVMFLLQLYMETGRQKYLDGAKIQMPVLEAFNGKQPSYHLNEIAVRHWDGYWFGKREMWGDTFPHYWSTLSGAAFYLYSQCTGDHSYKERAENIVRNNLCLFFEDGKASCAYIYPNKVNGVKGGFYDPYANDQDWALVYYLLVQNGIY